MKRPLTEWNCVNYRNVMYHNVFDVGVLACCHSALSWKMMSKFVDCWPLQQLAPLTFALWKAMMVRANSHNCCDCTVVAAGIEAWFALLRLQLWQIIVRLSPRFLFVPVSSCLLTADDEHHPLLTRTTQGSDDTTNPAPKQHVPPVPYSPITLSPAQPPRRVVSPIAEGPTRRATIDITDELLRTSALVRMVRADSVVRDDCLCWTGLVARVEFHCRCAGSKRVH